MKQKRTGIEDGEEVGAGAVAVDADVPRAVRRVRNDEADVGMEGNVAVVVVEAVRIRVRANVQIAVASRGLRKAGQISREGGYIIYGSQR